MSQGELELTSFTRLDTADSKAQIVTSISNVWSRAQLDPTSSAFDATAWFKHFAELRNGDHPLYKAKRGGFLFKNLNVYGTVKADDYLHTFGNAPLRPLRAVTRLFGRNDTIKVPILRGFEGIVNDGEMLAVLGRPGSGCTTLLKTLAGETRGLEVGKQSEILYQGIPPQTMHTEFRGECIYTAEVDVHFADLTVLETLQFAAACRAPKNLLPGMSKQEYIDYVTNVVLRIFNLSKARDTRIGDAMIRGVSGGEKKRVSIAEAFISFAPVQAWDNSTRGMDSATALDCIRNFRIFTQTNGAATIVSLYQASQDILDCFDKVTVLYEGRQIFFGTWQDAIRYFHNLGFERPSRLTTGDFLTALTNPQEARLLVSPDWTRPIPITVDEFVEAWQNSAERQKLLSQINDKRDEYLHRTNGLQCYREARALEKHPRVGGSSPFTIPIANQVALCLGRGFKRLKNNIGVPISYIIGNLVMAAIVGSVYLNLQESNDDVSKRTVLIFFAILINAFMSAAEVLTVWDQRPIVEKQTKHSLYHPLAEAISAIICDLPAKITASIFFNLLLYLMTNLRRTPQHFFTFWLFTFVCQMAMSMFYRLDGSMHQTLEASMVPVGVLVLLAIIYTGFVIPIPYMKPWLAWFRHINPVAYAFESLLINEFHKREFHCARHIPDGPFYEQFDTAFKTCSGTVAGLASNSVQGDSYIEVVYKYNYIHLWRNLGILLAFVIVFFALHLWSSEKVETQKPRGDLLLFLRKRRPQWQQPDEELNPAPGKIHHETHITSDAGLVNHKSVTHWENLSYEVPVKKGKKQILYDIDGWVKPGTLTVLMGATGAGKTTLLDVIAQRTTQGRVTGNIMVDGRQRDTSFQRSTGYAQQNDLHLPTATVREALHFSALLRQPHKLPKAIKTAYADRILELLGMQSYADAIVGVPGDGLSPEQRKRLTIAVELASRPSRLLFLDEPTSGLDSQTAFIICNLLRNLAHESGQAIMATIHQPSASLLEMFDQILLINAGRTVYFGPIGEDCKTMINYFESKGAPTCKRWQNPAEWVMDVSGASPGSKNTIDWHKAWEESAERQKLKQTLSEMRISLAERQPSETEEGEFATPVWTQIYVLTKRTFVEYWRTPAAIYAKLIFYAGASFMIGVSCLRSPNSLQGLQNQLFSIFLIFTTFSNVLQQIAPQFGSRRALYEARERPSKIFSWTAFITSSIVVEAAWQVLLATISFILFYYITGMDLNTTDADRHERGFLMLLLFIEFFLFTQSLSHLLVAAIEVPQAAVNMGQPIFYLTIIFCGVLVPFNYLPEFWKFMYRVSPLTYLTRSIFAVGVAHQPITCSSSELTTVSRAPEGFTCGEYFSEFVKQFGGNVVNADATTNCGYCPMRDTDEFLKFFSMDYNERWRDFAIIMVYIGFNWMATFALYWLARVPKKQKKVEASAKKNAV
ncbi:uncharacterized protein EI97DRAFT_433130 [Westerdykella ornata]|uniref:ABC transporter domain-containing protein n=1 Tax=Westerdykella ornata TaxID=318751 RepID=A0A6A6JMM9_WESOR|nr:uncharacterized protein EI97DRAFT_433130 [Westerdykella ornata]KAF2276916.1 hypothetical protein EI97DRAFT_433130 [Westerdykella ornata]